MSRVLVATGRLGRPVAMHLQDEGYEVRALTRRPELCNDLRRVGIEVVSGDPMLPQSLTSACAGCDIVYISLRGHDEVAGCEQSEVTGVENLVQAARAAGVGRIAYLSAAGKVAGNERHAPARIQIACERLIESSGIAYTIFRAAQFMESLPTYVRGTIAEVLGRQPNRFHYLAAEDYARIVARAFAEPGAANRTFAIFGPHAYTIEEALRVYLDHAHLSMQIRVAPLGILRIVARLTDNRQLLCATQLFTALCDMGEEGEPQAANALLGAATTTLEQWSARRA